MIQTVTKSDDNEIVFTADSMKNNTQWCKWKDFFKQSISFSKTFVDFQAKATDRQIYISPFTFENNSDEVHITGCFGKRPETKYNGECLE